MAQAKTVMEYGLGSLLGVWNSILSFPGRVWGKSPDEHW